MRSAISTPGQPQECELQHPWFLQKWGPDLNHFLSTKQCDESSCSLARMSEHCLLSLIVMKRFYCQAHVIYPNVNIFCACLYVTEIKYIPVPLYLSCLYCLFVLTLILNNLGEKKILNGCCMRSIDQLLNSHKLNSILYSTVLPSLL